MFKPELVPTARALPVGSKARADCRDEGVEPTPALALNEVPLVCTDDNDGEVFWPERGGGIEGALADEGCSAVDNSIAIACSMLDTIAELKG